MLSIVLYHIALPVQALTDNSGVHFLPDVTIQGFSSERKILLLLSVFFHLKNVP